LSTEKPSGTATRPRSITLCNGKDLQMLWQAGTVWLERHASSINALNVFPVPDGDTGTNMLLTMRAALEECASANNQSAAQVAQATAHGALMGARGNSGVILSQMLRGMATSLKGKRRFDADDFARALSEGSATAYKGVIKPVEGTILTVGRESAEAARAAVDDGVRDFTPLMERVVAAAKESVSRTPLLLSVLREAGVVDAGGEGLYVILEGALRHLRGEAMETDEIVEATPSAAVKPAGEAELEWGYCTEFVLQGRGLDVEELRKRIGASGDSAMVVGDESTVKVHVHTFRPGEVIDYASSKGTLHNIKIDNMQDQHREYLVMGSEAVETTEAASQQEDGIAIVAVVSGPGLEEVFTSLGVSTIVPGGQTMNPSTQELLQAIESLNREEVIVLPNNDNVLLAAEKAKELSAKTVVVVPSETIPQGISALLAFNYQADLSKNAQAMAKALKSIQTAEITRAIRSVRINGMQVEKGEVIGLLNGELVASGPTIGEVALKLLEQMNGDEYEIITAYYGEDVPQAEADALLRNLEEHYPSQEWELVDGGQPHYYYILSAE
jgi:DAK2 domain fusion protein YloV